MKTLHYAGFQPGAKGFGWATCNENLRAALGKRFALTDATFPEVVFMPLADHDFNPASQARGRINVAYSFFEYPLGDKAAENAAKYDTVFVGSTWCLDRCFERGITNAKVLIQGVDHSIFHPGDSTASDRQFRIFSGGKFEWRKGQDLVIRAFAEFAKTHPDAHLVCSWVNPWPQLAYNVLCRPDNELKVPLDRIGDCRSWEEVFAALLIANGIPRDRFTILPQLSQAQLAAEMRNTDVGLFPNRCEGGTNLVLMEYAACGRPVVANVLTGHADMRDAIDYEIPAIADENNWAVSTIEEILSPLEAAYYHRHPVGNIEACKWTWAAAANTVAEEVERISKSK